EYILVYTETNAFGCEASCEFVIVVNPLPEFDCPEYGPFCKGDPAIVFDEPGVFTLNGDVVTGFDPVAPGEYTLVYTETNAFGCDNSCSFIIKVLPVPVILSQPESVAELYGYDITFSITADFATSIEWYGPDGLIMTDENVTTSVLSIEKITLNDVGEYYCKVINECGFLFSDTVYLEVLPWTQIIDLPSYLNGVSTYLDLIDCDVETIMSQLENELLALEFIKKVYVPGSITFCWNEAEGAKLYLKEDTWPTEFSVTGYPTLGTEMPIKAGWSIIPVWSSEPVYAQDIFEQLGNNLIIAVSINYNEVYWPQGNIHTLNYLEPSRAYLVKVNNEATVMWNTITVSHAIHHPDMTNTSIWPDPNITGNFHLISISTNAISDLSIGDYIGVFDKNGTIAGLTEVTDFSENILLIAFADDNYSGKINDLSNNGKMYFKIYKPSTGEVNNIQPLFSENMPNSDLFYTYGMSMIESINGEKASVEEVLNSTYYINIHPNPVENTTYLTSNKKIQSVKLLNVTGQEMMKLNIDDTHGELDLSRFKSGSYIVQIQFENGLIVTRQLIIK
ncbi:MAG TPA: T9SS type A sorting domain-containing protein, partial [Bacteroidales bacterium]|nr:T9SS type A sorting domain-containing protein [Bacteroidales bacterium]